MSESAPLQYIKGVGPRLAEKLSGRNLRTVRDALFFFPRAYEDRRKVAKIREISPGIAVPVRGTVLDVRGGLGFRGRSLLEVAVSDGTGRLVAKWFHAHPSLKDRFRVGERITLCGAPRVFMSRLEMHHPEILAATEESDPVHLGRIVPVYPEVEGVPQRVLRKIQWEVVSRHAAVEKEFLPRWILEAAGVPPLEESLSYIHFPPSDADIGKLLAFGTPAQKRLVFGELFRIQWEMACRRRGAAREAGIALPWDREIVGEIKKRLPFTLTNAQRRVVNEILGDMSRPHPMHRLLQGDVGSGKTIVAWIAAMVAWRNGVQAALMAPTEILAEQHYGRFSALCEGLSVRVVLLTALQKGKERERVREEIRSGKAHLVVGTHALIQQGVDFGNLGLAVIDEQHRFGVLQRAALKGKAATAPHLLVMTATPIPRTLAMTLYGDLDVSLIDEMPPGRLPVRTRVVREESRFEVRKTIMDEISAGGRIYVVLPLVEESEKLSLRDATREADRIRRLFPEAGVGLLHGRMKAEEKESTMRLFKEGVIRILVSTTVVEVGVDVPEATVMTVEHAERFGLSQLHQLRGRVGRGTRPSFCFLMVGAPEGEEAAARLSVMERTNDGFRIAEEDLKIRGPGDFAGVRQSGIPDLVFSDIVRDAKILMRAREIARMLIEQDPGLDSAEHRKLDGWLRIRDTSMNLKY